jgi:glycerol-1-phosphatase
MGVGEGAGSDHLMVALARSPHQAAFAAYEAVRTRWLPPPTRAGRAVELGSLDDLADLYDVLLLDAFGVLNEGEHAIPGVPDRVAGLQARGKRVIVVSNAAGYPHALLMERYARLGYRFDPEDVVTSRKAVLRAARSRPAGRWGLIADKRYGRAELEGMDTISLGDDPLDYDTVDAFLFLGASAWSDKRQAMLTASLGRSPRPVLIGNPDLVAPRETGLSREPGHYGFRIIDDTGIRPEFFGKPFPAVFELARHRVGGDVDPGRVVMVGDTPHTDILGGQRAGHATALVTGFGLMSGLDPTDVMARSGIVPDFLLKTP